MSDPVETDHRETVDELARLIEEFRLAGASLSAPGFKVAFGKIQHSAGAHVSHTPSQGLEPINSEPAAEDDFEDEAPVPLAGTPISSPMNGIYYASSSPGSAPFVSVGSEVEAGQVVGLIEAMKVFNEITSPSSGTVSRIVAEAGAVVQPGDVLMILT